MAVVSNSELMEKFGLTEEEVNETVSHKEPKSKILAFDKKAQERGISRSQALREATELWLMEG